MSHTVCNVRSKVSDQAGDTHVVRWTSTLGCEKSPAWRRMLGIARIGPGERGVIKPRICIVASLLHWGISVSSVVGDTRSRHPRTATLRSIEAIVASRRSYVYTMRTPQPVHDAHTRASRQNHIWTILLRNVPGAAPPSRVPTHDSGIPGSNKATRPHLAPQGGLA